MLYYPVFFVGKKEEMPYFCFITLKISWKVKEFKVWLLNNWTEVINFLFVTNYSRHFIAFNILPYTATHNVFIVESSAGSPILSAGWEPLSLFALNASTLQNLIPLSADLTLEIEKNHRGQSRASMVDVPTLWYCIGTECAGAMPWSRIQEWVFHKSGFLFF